MAVPELAQLEMLAQIDELVERLTDWAAAERPWEPLNHSRLLVRRVLERVETLRIRLEAPLVVATFGGTGTGKSALVNALVGQACTPSGRQRPTTTRPVLISHVDTELEPLALPLETFQIVRLDVPILRDIVIIDCPDPDTNEAETAGSNLERLRQLLPHCDVLLYVATQQKYRSNRVVLELAQAATGCRLIFVQTYADVDEDIREDWRRHLEPHYAVPEMFFVDSVRALQEQQAGQRPGGDFSRLLDLLAVQLAASHRTQIRRANLLDLVQGALEHCRTYLHEHQPQIAELEQALEVQRARLVNTMSRQLREELLTSRGLWERRLLSSVTEIWGLSPFSSVLRTYNGLGNLLASASFFRARSSAQLAIIGAVQGARWWNSLRQEQAAESRLERAGSLGLDDALLREAQLIVAGYAQTARLDPQLADSGSFEALRHEAVRVEGQFLGDASRRVDEIIDQLSLRHSGWLTRLPYEVLLSLFLAYLLGRIGKNFFWDSVFFNAPIMTLDFYLPAGIFLALWAGVLVMAFTARLRRGLDQRIHALAEDLAHGRMSAGLFPKLEQVCREARLQTDRLETLYQTTVQIRHDIALNTGLGAQVTRLPAPPTPENRLATVH